METPKKPDAKRPPRVHAKRRKARGEAAEMTWHKPDYQIVEASMEMTAYFLTR
ncbi:pyrroloquinoline quinone precursor peptide PqqA [Spongiactinospora rosea]|uniref:Coenzyme PQQ synthesis protein A n=2 Tax=Spongiactinospora TaxID=2871671 RepID=A0A2W2GGW9_9ACTN|nr:MULTISPECIES: pyrroloquinoline quinone precursor peptide PqqA [Spongiactinospora]PZG36600.1 pyrroloquinoline quinone precursor peptide PqqA [Spongiactinospora gelatinilytica]RBQ19668.1 pyrroloquinoline quinone precursor peptide PqqA [Spongiactinospora rosea]